MSRAHVREVDGDVPEDLPELPLSPHPNYVTPRGLALLQQRLDQADRRISALPADAADTRQSRAAIDRERRWLQARVASAQRVAHQDRPMDRVAFGALVTVINDDGVSSRYRIVGEDEAEPETGRISWTSPLARALIGVQVGESVIWARPAGDLEVTIQAIDFTPEDAG